MRTLTFYPRREDGSSQAFCVADIDSDESEALFVRQMFATHDSAAMVEVFEGPLPTRIYHREILAKRHPEARRPGLSGRAD